VSGRVGADDKPIEKPLFKKRNHTSVERMRRAGDKLTQSNSSKQVIKLAKCGGVVAHDKSFQSAIEKELLQDYFYGTMPQEALGVKALPGKLLLKKVGLK